MIPLRDINPAGARPVLTWGLIAINTQVFLYQWWLSEHAAAALLQQWGLIPYYLSGGHLGSISTVLTSMFLHGSVAHLIFNMWFLFLFADNVEHVLGARRFAIFYALSGAVAAFTHVAIDRYSVVPMIGASGAIAGVLAAHLRLFPRALPAVLFIGLWFLAQVLNAVQTLDLGDHNMGNQAIFAHIGGFVAGLYLIGRLLPLEVFRPGASTGADPWS